MAEYQITTAQIMIERGYQDNEISAVTSVPVKAQEDSSKISLFRR